MEGVQQMEGHNEGLCVMWRAGSFRTTLCLSLGWVLHRGGGRVRAEPENDAVSLGPPPANPESLLMRMSASPAILNASLWRAMSPAMARYSISPTILAEGGGCSRGWIA